MNKTGVKVQHVINFDSEILPQMVLSQPLKNMTFKLNVSQTAEYLILILIPPISYQPDRTPHASHPHSVV